MVVPELHRRIEVLRRRDALLERADPFAHEQCAEPGGDEAREVADLDRLFAERVAEVEGATQGRRAGLNRAHDLDEAHCGHRVEEVRPDDLTWPLAGRAEDFDRQAAGVRREDRVVVGREAERGEDGALQVQVLGHRLDHDVGGGRSDRQIRGEIERTEAGELGPLRPCPRFVVRDPRPCGLEELGLRLDDRDREPGDAGLERDARAHDPSPDDDGARGHDFPSVGDELSADSGRGSRRRRMNVPLALETRSPSMLVMVVSR